MARKKHRYHFIYKTTCLINNNYYIGMHSTDNLSDGYIGSGVRIRNSIRAHGRKYHEIEILEFFENRELLIQREIELVNKELLKDPMCMNLMEGGYGGLPKFSSLEKQKNFHRLGAISTNNKIKENPSKWKNSMSDNSKKISSKLKSLYESGEFIPPFKHKNHSEETILKMKDSARGKHEGEKNSQYGTCWITNGTENKKIKKTDDLPEGWSYGRR
jgi:hypothetical protein